MRRMLGEEVLPNALGRPWAVRVGDTVRRPRHARSDAVAALLRRLERGGFTGAPRHLGADDADRDVFAWIDGEVVHDAAALSDGRLASAGRLIRRLHDAGAVHGDLGPHNTVFRGEEAVGIIDWDETAGLGPPSDDFAQAAWSFAAVAEDALPLAEQARRVGLLCGAYGAPDVAAVVDALAASFVRAATAHRAAGRTTAADVFDGLIAWMDRNAPALKAGALRSTTSG